MFKAVIFDLDGTLIDSMQLWREVDSEFLGKRGIPVPSDLFDNMPQGNSFIQTATYFKNRFNLPDTYESIMQEWTDMVSFHYTHTVALKHYAAATLEYIHKLDLRIGLGTSNSYELAEKVLLANNVWHYFEAIVTGDMHLLGKPFPDIYLKAASLLNVAPSDCLVIEDTLSGIQAAKSAGMTAFAIYDADSDGHRDQINRLADKSFGEFRELIICLQEMYINHRTS